MISVIIYLIFDYASAICLIYMNKVPRWLLRFTHQGFIFFLQSTLSLIYLYTDLYKISDFGRFSILTEGKFSSEKGQISEICSTLVSS